MKLSKIKEILPALDNVEFQVENGTFVPEHFHVTEVGVITKHFIDCGGTIRNEKDSSSSSSGGSSSHTSSSGRSHGGASGKF